MHARIHDGLASMQIANLHALAFICCGLHCYDDMCMYFEFVFQSFQNHIQGWTFFARQVASLLQDDNLPKKIFGAEKSRFGPNGATWHVIHGSRYVCAVDV
jgi:hypothetical protein